MNIDKGRSKKIILYSILSSKYLTVTSDNIIKITPRLKIKFLNRAKLKSSFDPKIINEETNAIRGM